MSQQRIYPHLGNECNNCAKEIESRPAIVSTIKEHFGGRPISFVELLGSGVGADYYAEKLNIRHMTVIECVKKKYNDYVNRMSKHRYAHPLFPWLTLFEKNGTTINPIRVQLVKYLDSICGSKKDVINLDFCTFLRREENLNSPVTPIKIMFKRKLIKDNGLVFFTFQLTGPGVNWDKRAIKDDDEIKAFIHELAEEHGYKAEDVLYLKYKSSSVTTMLNYGIKVSSI